MTLDQAAQEEIERLNKAIADRDAMLAQQAALIQWYEARCKLLALELGRVVKESIDACAG